jgi:tetratricopeptide (TPR) repeat protein
MRRLPLLAIAILAACATTPAAEPPLVRKPLPALAADPEREALLAEARKAYEANPNDADAIIWLGRRTAYLGRYYDAIEVFTEGIRKHPNDARMYRHRGHRFLTVRELDRAIRDLETGERLSRGKPDEIEPDGLPNARNIPIGSLQSNLCYHLGLAHYLKHDFERTLPVWQRCNTLSINPDRLVSTSHWLYMTLRRLGRVAEAEKVLEPISSDLDVIENQSYHKLLLMYGGDIAPEELARENDPAVLYGVGNWYLVNGRPEDARKVFDRILAGGQWATFGYIAAERE